MYMYHSLRLANSRLASRALHFESVFVQRQRASLLLARRRECISVQSHVNQFRVTVAVTCNAAGPVFATVLKMTRVYIVVLIIPITRASALGEAWRVCQTATAG